MSFFGLETPPAWAFNWCYYFAAMAALAFLNGLTAIFYSKNLGLLLTVLFMIEEKTFPKTKEKHTHK